MIISWPETKVKVYVVRAPVTNLPGVTAKSKKLGSFFICIGNCHEAFTDGMLEDTVRTSIGSVRVRLLGFLNCSHRTVTAVPGL